MHSSFSHVQSARFTVTFGHSIRINVLCPPKMKPNHLGMIEGFLSFFELASFFYAFRIFTRMEATDIVDSWYESLFEQALYQNVLTRLF